MKKAYLHMTTWKGSMVVMYAEHFYGTIYFGEDQHTVCTELTESEAIKLNKSAMCGMSYKPGDECSQFFTEEKLKAKGIKLFNKDPHGYDILLYGDRYVCDPQEMLVGPMEMKAAANKLWAEFESFNGWECKEEEEATVRDICKAWEEIVGSPLEV